MTLQERAKEYADNYVVGDAAIITDLLHKVALESYQVGATEQKKIDIEKTCKWLIGYTTYPYTDKGNISKKKLDIFRKAMEEYV